MDKKRRLLTVIYFFTGVILLLLEWQVATSFFIQKYALPIRFVLLATGITLIILAHRTFWKSIPTGSALGCYFLLAIFFIYALCFFKVFLWLTQVFQFASLRIDL